MTKQAATVIFLFNCIPSVLCSVNGQDSGEDLDGTPVIPMSAVACTGSKTLDGAFSGISFTFVTDIRQGDREWRSTIVVVFSVILRVHMLSLVV